MNSSEIKQVVLGTMWGDAHVDYNPMSGKARLDLYHCSQQLPFLKWKSLVLESVTGIKCNISEKIDKRSLKYGNRREGYRLQTNFSSYLGKLHKSPKIYSLKQLVKPLGLATLWQDDGTLVYCNKGYYSTANLCLDSWGKDEVLKFKDLWNKQYGWSPEFQNYTCRGSTYPRLRMRKREMVKFSDIIKSYIQPCLKYKIIGS